MLQKPADTCKLCLEPATMSPCDLCPVYEGDTKACESPVKNFRTCSTCGEEYLARIRLGVTLLRIFDPDLAMEIAATATRIKQLQDNIN